MVRLCCTICLGCRSLKVIDDEPHARHHIQGIDEDVHDHPDINIPLQLCEPPWLPRPECPAGE